MNLLFRAIGLVLVFVSLGIEPVSAGWLRRARGRCRCEVNRCAGGPRTPNSQARAEIESAGPADVSQPRRASDHESLFDGKTLGRWKVADTFTFDSHGEVRVRDGRIELLPGSPGTGIVWSGKPPRINYELTLDAMRTDGSDFFCGLTFPVGDEYCSLIVGGWGGGLVGLSNVNAMPANENDTTSFGEFEDDTWYRLRLRVVTDRITVWIDDQKLFSQPTKDCKFDIWWEQEPMRPLGIASWYTGAALRNITLTRIKNTGE